MNVALIILHADPARGGAERYTLDLAVGLLNRGHDVSLLATTFGDVPEGIHRVVLDGSGITRIGRYQTMLNALDEHLSRKSYDIVHAMLPVRHCDVYHPHAGIALEALKAPALQRVFNPRRTAMAEVERQLLTAARPPVLLCLSDYVKQHVIASYPELPPDRMATLFNAVSLNYFDPRGNHDRSAVRTGRGVGSDDIVALIVAQDFERKGVPQAIEATRRVNAQRKAGEARLRLIVVGAGHAPASDGDVIYAGVSHKILLFYAAADFFVLPTRHDPCSLVVLEALAMGVPVISTRFNGACEIMTDGVHGFVLPDPDDVSALADAMRKTLDPQLRQRMSAACLELRPQLSYEHHLDRLIEIYQQRIGGRF